MFPVIRHINDVIPHIKDKTEIIIAEKEDFTVLNYVVSTDTTFDNPFAVECRGIKFGKDGKIIARPFHKFFNVNQIAETQVNVISHKFDKPHTIMPKLDGSMIHPVLIKGEIRLCTKMGITEVAEQAEKFLKENKHYCKMIHDFIESGVTPIFEWTSRQQQIVLDYPVDSLTLLAARSNIYGTYADHSCLEKVGIKYKIPVVPTFANSSSVDNLLKEIKNLEGEEGIVVRFDDGMMVKVKSDWYCLRHSSRDLLTQEYKVVQLILKEEIDDIKPLLVDDDVKKVEDIEKYVEDSIEWHTTMLNSHFKFVSEKFETRKEFAISVYAKQLTSFTKSAMFGMMDGKNARELSIAYMKDQCNQDSIWKKFKGEKRQ